MCVECREGFKTLRGVPSEGPNIMQDFDTIGLTEVGVKSMDELHA